jgi:hypothetical protein
VLQAKKPDRVRMRQANHARHHSLGDVAPGVGAQLTEAAVIAKPRSALHTPSIDSRAQVH